MPHLLLLLILLMNACDLGCGLSILILLSPLLKAPLELSKVSRVDLIDVVTLFHVQIGDAGLSWAIDNALGENNEICIRRSLDQEGVGANRPINRDGRGHAYRPHMASWGLIEGRLKVEGVVFKSHGACFWVLLPQVERLYPCCQMLFFPLILSLRYWGIVPLRIPLIHVFNRRLIRMIDIYVAFFLLAGIDILYEIWKTLNLTSRDRYWWD